MNTNSQKKPELKSLSDALLTLKTTEDIARFLGDICTPTELDALQERWAICQLITQGYSYRAIQSLTGASPTTTGRVHRFISVEPFKGYGIALERLGIEASKEQRTGGRPKGATSRHQSPHEDLTTPEGQVIALRNEGMSPVHIAHTLGLTVTTVGQIITRQNREKPKPTS